ncbi:FBP domain-containing protein [Segeticoccus rhizosphaerae]|uniref:FBP domain-containing protein n=1 Tax=Segeticoccus rhizosphaerae TaxID=1104777 RepID=UPI00126425DA|nr:FBP domain-containing protein [Segeticoccus rhizosphaerae]
MTPLTEQAIRASFVNATRREANRAIVPDLSAVDWEQRDYLGWRDPKQPLASYAVVEVDTAPGGGAAGAFGPVRRAGARRAGGLTSSFTRPGGRPRSGSHQRLRASSAQPTRPSTDCRWPSTTTWPRQ